VRAEARIRRLEGAIQRYAWGSRTALARLQGRPAPTAEPEAELWLGAHPRGTARVLEGGDATPLPEWIARDPETRLGARVRARFGGALPFLVKILAVERPLSLQAHPDAEQAREGFEREGRAGLAPDAPGRSYRDPRAKPELVCALARFRALAGLRPLPQVRERLAAAGAEAGLPARSEAGGPPVAGTFRELLEWLLGLPPAASRALLAGAAAQAGTQAGDPASAWVARLARAYPGDPAALAPLFLELVELEAGEALFLPPGELHVHLEGLALEVMACSDNVVRAGLTEKPVDARECLRIARLEPRRPEVLRPPPDPAETVYPTPTREFRLSRLRPGPERPCTLRTGGGLEILVCAAGEARLESAGEAARFGPGAAALVPAAAGEYRVEGDCTLYRVGVPDSSV
jgi:mannose-6-phosphate isomerase